MPDMPPLPPGRPSYNRPPRRKTGERGYDGTHQKLRKALLAKFPVCQWCGEDWSKHYHHACKDPHCRNPEHAVAVCEACHLKHHARERHGG